MPALNAFVRTHSVSAYFALTFAVSWGGSLLAIGGAGGMLGTTPASDPRFAYALLAMLAGPSIAGILFTSLGDGGHGIREFRSRLVTWRVGLTWYAVALLTAPAAMIATLLALSFTSPAFLPGIFTSHDKATLLLVSVAVGLSAGIFEELGWTGFALPAVRRRYSVVGTGLVVGVWWSAWHLLPTVWSSRAAAGELEASVYLAATALGVFVGYLTAFRVVMVWVYEHTRSILIAMLMHLSLTTSLLALNPIGISGTHLVTYSFAFAAVMWVIAGVVALLDRRGKASQPVWRRAA
jgi:membrane protease YdiL (CAAX protease family)